MEADHIGLSSSILLFFLLIHSITAVESATVDDFIKKCCSVTLYTDLCYSKLSGEYKGPVNDLGMLTCTAIQVSLTEARKVATYVKSMNQTGNGGSRVAKAVKDCSKLTKSAAGQVKQSMGLMAKVVENYAAKPNGGARNETEVRKMRFQMSSVQTWMSAGITYEGTCMEGFKDEGVKDNEDVVKDMGGRVGVAMKLISNALALVNTYKNAS